MTKEESTREEERCTKEESEREREIVKKCKREKMRYSKKGSMMKREI